ncbi:hypothetical protein VNO77_00380 [Canavalia gladiata]|uniref:Uncharacterized protein n=1 Tax=Canavalia gladiata TaxID=3824 RepID=A0AAN9MPX0_CANGL
MRKEDQSANIRNEKLENNRRMEKILGSNPWTVVCRKSVCRDPNGESHSISRTLKSCDPILLTDPKSTLLKLSFPSTCAAHNKKKSEPNSWEYLYYR